MVAQVVKFGGPKVIWSASLKSPVAPAKIAVRGAMRQVVQPEHVFRSAMPPRFANVTQVPENDHLFDVNFAPHATEVLDEGASMADGSISTTRACSPGFDFGADDEWSAHDAMPLDLWREYVQAANAGAFSSRFEDDLAEEEYFKDIEEMCEREALAELRASKGGAR